MTSPDDGHRPVEGKREASGLSQGIMSYRLLCLIRAGGSEVVSWDGRSRLVAFRRQAAAGGPSVMAIFDASGRWSTIGPRDLKLAAFRGWKHRRPDAVAISGGLDVPPHGSTVVRSEIPWTLVGIA